MALHTAQILQRKTNSKGVTYSLQIDNGSLADKEAPYGVWKLCVNYVRGKDVKTWRYVETGLTLEAAQKLFDRRSK
jgi:hypothetical protein